LTIPLAQQSHGETWLLDEETLRDLVTRVLRAAGSEADIAAQVAESLVASNLRGVDSHGFMRVPDYLDAVRRGRIDPAARPRTVRDEGAVVVVDGNRAFGQVAARVAALAAVEKARRHGIGAAVLSGSLHVGRVGEFVELAAGQGHVAVAFCNGGPAGGLVAPYGGRARALGTNPIAFAVPGGERPPIVADFSTAIAAEGKIRLFKTAGRELPEGWIVDSNGAPSVDPADLYDGGAILPMAGHKGFAIGLLVEVLGGVLAGAGCASRGDDAGNGLVIVVIDAERFLPGVEFGAEVDRVIEAVEATQPAEGFAGVVVPGSPELDELARRRADGVPFSSATWRSFAEAAASVGVDVPLSLAREAASDV
jgi:LDH2 family malate/lactate/ureidoglycolate dehydrogenase